MKPSTRYVLIGAATLLATVAGLFVAQHIQTQAINSRQTDDSAKAVTQLLALTLPDSQAVNQSLGQWRGKILVVNFWATWCAPCREEMPGFSRLQQRFSDKGVQFVGIAFDNADKVQQFSLQTPVTYPLLIGASNLLMITAGLGNHAGGLPFTVLIDKSGNLLESRLGVWQEAKLEALLQDLTR